MKIRELPRMTEKARRGLGETLEDDAPELAAAIEEGRAQLWEIDDGETYAITRMVRRLGRRPELVVCAIRGRGARNVARRILDRARAHGCEAVRFHTRRPALGRMVRDLGFQETHRVYVARLDP